MEREIVDQNHESCAPQISFRISRFSEDFLRYLTKVHNQKGRLVQQQFSIIFYLFFFAAQNLGYAMLVHFYVFVLCSMNARFHFNMKVC